MSSRAQRRKHEIDQGEARKNFINNLSKLFKFILSKNRQDSILLDIKDKFIIARKEDPDLVVQKAGEYLLKYGKQIQNKDVRFFLTGDFKEDIEKATEDEFMVDESSVEYIETIIQTARKTWRLFSNLEQETIMKLVQRLLSDAAKYTLATRALAT